MNGLPDTSALKCVLQCQWMYLYTLDSCPMLLLACVSARHHIASSKFLCHNIFLNCIIYLKIMKILFTKYFECMSRDGLYSMLAEKWAGQHWIMKILSNHEIFITKIIYFNANLERFTKFLNHENLGLYGSPCSSTPILPTRSHPKSGVFPALKNVIFRIGKTPLFWPKVGEMGGRPNGSRRTGTNSYELCYIVLLNPFSSILGCHALCTLERSQKYALLVWRNY